MNDHAMPFDIDEPVSEPAPAPYQYNFGVTTAEWGDQDIVAFHASIKYVEVVLRGDFRRPLVNDTLKMLAVDPRYAHDFIAVHRGTLVRTSAIAELRRVAKHDRYEVVLEDGQTFTVSRRMLSAVRVVLANARTRACAQLDN